MLCLSAGLLGLWNLISIIIMRDIRNLRSINYLEGGFQGLKGRFSSRGLREEMFSGKERFSGSK